MAAPRGGGRAKLPRGGRRGSGARRHPNGRVYESDRGRGRYRPERGARGVKSRAASGYYSDRRGVRDAGGDSNSDTEEVRPKYPPSSKSYGNEEDIIRMLRKLYREDNLERYTTLAKSIQMAVLSVENGIQVRRGYGTMLSWLLDCVRAAAGSVYRRQVVTIIANIGQALAKSDLLECYVTCLLDNFDQSGSSVLKKCLLSALDEMYTVCSGLCAGETADATLQRLQMLLEVQDSADLMKAIVSCIINIVHLHPSAFAPYFKDTVDILVGWHIDLTQTSDVTQFATDAMLRLDRFWCDDVTFAVTLTSQFLEDIDSYTQELCEVAEDGEYTDHVLKCRQESAGKLLALVRVYTTVLTALHRAGVCLPDESRLLDSAADIGGATGIGGDGVRVILTALNTVWQCDTAEQLVSIGCSCLLRLLQASDSESVGSNGDLLVRFVTRVLTSLTRLVDDDLITVCRFFVTLFDSGCWCLWVGVVTDLFGDGSSLLQLRLSPSEKVRAAVLRVYHAALDVSTMSMVHLLYGVVTQQLKDSYRWLVDTDTVQCSTDTHTHRQIVTFSLHVLSRLVGGSVLSKDLTELLTVHLSPDSEALALKYPIVRHMILTLLYAHYDRGGHFVNSGGSSHADDSVFSATVLPSIGVNSSSTVSPSKGVNSSATVSPSAGDGIATVVQRICNILAQRCGTVYDTTRLLLLWSAELVELLCPAEDDTQNRTTCPPAVATDLLAAAVQCALTSHIVYTSGTTAAVLSTALAVCRRMVAALHWHILPVTLQRRLCELSLWGLDCTDGSCRKSAVALLPHIPTDQLIHVVRDCCEVTTVGGDDTWLGSVSRVRRHLSSHRLSVPMSHHVYTLYMESLQADGGSVDQSKRLEMLYLCLASLDTETGSSISGSRLTDDVALLTSRGSLLNYWLPQSAAEYLVANKLRVPPHKKADQCLLAVEECLVSCAGTSVDGSAVALTMLQCLSRAMHLAAAGSSVTPAVFNKVVRSFFHTNSTISRELLQKTRRHLLSAMSTNAYRVPPQMALSACYSMMQHDPVNRARQAVFAAVAAMNAGCCDTVRGLRQLLATTEASTEWMLAAELLAGDQLGPGADRLRDMLTERLRPGDVRPTTLHRHLSTQLVQSYTAVGRYQDAVRWITFMDSLNCPSSSAAHDVALYSVQNIQLLASFSQADYGQTVKLADQLPSDGSTFAAQLHVTACLAALARDARTVELPISVQLLTTALEAVTARLCAGLSEFPPRLSQEAVLCTQMLQQLVQVSAGGLSAVRVRVPSTAGTDCGTLDVGSLLLMTHWQRAVDDIAVQHGSRQQLSSDTGSRLCLLASKSLRRAGAPMQAASLLLTPSIPADMDLVTSQLHRLARDPLPALSMAAETRREAAKLLHCLGERGLAVDALLATPSADVTARSLLLLVDWLRDGQAHVVLTRLDEFLRRLTVSGSEVAQMGSVVVEHQLLIGRVLETAADISVDSSTDAWLQWADWCFVHGKQQSQPTQTHTDTHTDQLRHAVAQLMPNNTPRDVISRLCDVIVHREHAQQQDQDDDSSDIEDADAERVLSARDTLTALVSACVPDQLVAASVVEHLVQLWRGQQTQLDRLHLLSAAAYLRYLRLDSDSCEGGTLAALRLLRLLVRHTAASPAQLPDRLDELQYQLVEQLQDTPPRPWTAIIPQLYARLDHPERYVRDTVRNLLVSVSRVQQQLIVFPAAVGSDVSRTNTQSADAGDEASRRHCYNELVQRLALLHPDAVRDVSALVRELRRVTLLWDELWAGALLQCQSDVTRRLSALSGELQKICERPDLDEAECQTIAADKYSIAVAPVVYTLDRILQITSEKPETPHEQRFQSRFLPDLQSALHHLRTPIDPWNPRSSWDPFRRLLARIQEQLQNRPSQTLTLSDISPVLAVMKDTHVCMPGVNPPVTVSYIEPAVSILPTKTKPKKIHLCGSDGKRYPYLFKGLEDLHLDERIMQLLTVTNQMLAKQKRDRGTPLYRARNYAVVPLGSRSGLIQWVQGGTPLFGIYKRWQQRSASSNNTVSGVGGLPAGSVRRPSELFSEKLESVLQSRAMPITLGRRDVPADVLTSVLCRLVEDTPSDIIAQELSCSSTSAGHWWSLTRSYTASLAVMSMVGYIIGLGDRHLDNLLMDFRTGEVVHIDYNVCFEKGRTLRVPEQVPYRLTQNLIVALGVTGVEGAFRAGCERVLSTLRTGSETLLTLLEAFVFDPLVDWTPANDAGFTGAVYGGEQAGVDGQMRQQVERNLTVSLFCVQVAEMKCEWLKNRDSIGESLSELHHGLAEYETLMDDQTALEELSGSLTEQHGLLAEAVNSRAHGLWTLPKRWRQCSDVSAVMADAQARLDTTIEQWQQWDAAYQTADSVLFGHGLVEWTQVATGLGFHPCNETVLDFLVSAGQQQLANQCRDMDGLIRERLERLLAPLQAVLCALRRAASLLSYMPVMPRRNSHRCRFYLTWLSQLKQQLNTESVRDVTELFSVTLGDGVEQLSSDRAAIVSDCRAELRRALSQNRQRIQQLEGLVCNDEDTLESDISSLMTAVCRVSEHDSVAARNCAVMSAMYTAGKQMARIESTVSDSGDKCHELRSADGLWLVDEFCCTVSWLSRLAGILHIDGSTADIGGGGVDCGRLVQQFIDMQLVTQSLQELQSSFNSIIMPEALKYVMQEEPSVLQMISRVNDVINSTGQPITAIIAGLEQHVRRLVFGMPSDQLSMVETAQRLRTAFLAEVNRSEDPNMSQGQMLLMGFNILFDSVEQRTETLLSRLEFVKQWNTIDSVRDASALMPPVRNSSIREVVQLITFILRVELLQNFFTKCIHNAAVFSGMTSVDVQLTLSSDQQLTVPLRQYMCKFVRRALLGVPSLLAAYLTCHLADNTGINLNAEVSKRDVGASSRVPLSQLVRAALELSLSNETVTSSQLSSCQHRLEQLEHSCKKQTLFRWLIDELEQCRRSDERYRALEAAHLWFYYQIPGTCTDRSLGRDTILDQLNRSIGATKRCPAVWELSDDFLQLSQSVQQRLKWAAGANEQLTQLLEGYTEWVSGVCARMSELRSLLDSVTEVSRSVLHEQRLRGRGTEAAAEDTRFQQLLVDLKPAAALSTALDSGVSPVERTLAESLSPLPDSLSTSWFAESSALIQDLQAVNQDELSDKRAQLFVCWDAVRAQVVQSRDLLGRHHKLTVDVRLLLKSIAKSSEQYADCVDVYMTLYRQFSDELGQLVRSLLNESVTRDNVRRYALTLQQLQQAAGPVYDQLIELAAQLSVCASADKQSMGAVREERAAVKEQPATSRGGTQRCNQYALAVWRRIRQKLQGRDPDPIHTVTVQQQVEYTLQEASCQRNLALMYEGWTPWV